MNRVVRLDAYDSIVKFKEWLEKNQYMMVFDLSESYPSGNQNIFIEEGFFDDDEPGSERAALSFKDNVGENDYELINYIEFELLDDNRDSFNVRSLLINTEMDNWQYISIVKIVTDPIKCNLSEFGLD